MDQASFAPLDGLTEAFRRVWSEASGIAAAPAPTRQIAQAFARAGDRLVCGSADPLDTALAELRRRFGPLDLPYARDPALTVRLASGADIAVTAAAIRSLAHAGAELVLINDHRDPLTPLLRALAPNLVLLDAALAGTVQPRGNLLVVLDGTVRAPSAAALAGLLEHREAVVVGPAVIERARRRGVLGALRAAAPAPAPAPARLGLRLCVARESLGSMEAFGSEDADAVLDFALGAAARGLPVVLRSEPAAGGLA